MTVQLDNKRPVRRHAMLCVIGNVGTLRGNLTLIPGRSPVDGLPDLFILRPGIPALGQGGSKADDRWTHQEG